MSDDIKRIVRNYMEDPFEAKLNTRHEVNVNIEHQFAVVKRADKLEALVRFLDVNPDMRGVVFCRTKRETQNLAEDLLKRDYKADALHGDLSQHQRDRVMGRFKNHELQVLIATDVAARGIDIPAVSHVYNIHLPEVPENYVHRIGRTARAGRDGEAVAFCAPDERKLLRDIQRLMNIDIEVAGDDGSMNSPAPDAPIKKGRGNGNRGHRGADGKVKKKKGRNRPAGGEGTGSKPPSKKHPRRAAKPAGGGNAVGADSERRPRRSSRGKPANGARPASGPSNKPARAKNAGGGESRPRRNTRRPRG